MAVKKKIEEKQGKDNYPWGQQMLIFNGQVLKDESTLDENKVSEDGFLVVMFGKVGLLCYISHWNLFSYPSHFFLKYLTKSLV